MNMEKTTYQLRRLMRRACLETTVPFLYRVL
jgi:hypothetical protein